jgi:hypothetical protein
VPPPLGLWPITVFAGWVLSTYRGCTLKPFAWSSEAACSNGSPTTEGTSSGCGPFDTLSRTRLPTVSFTPAFGSCAVTSPAAFSDGTLCRSGFSRSFVSAATASVDCCPTRSGTADFGSPVETQMCTWLSLGNRFPATGSCLNTSPRGVVRLEWWSTSGWNPSALIFTRACASGMFRYSSTATGFVELSLFEISLYRNQPPMPAPRTKSSAATHGHIGRRCIGSSRS